MKKGQRDSGSFGRLGKTSFLPDDSFLFEDELEVRGLTTATVITSTVWLVEILQLSAGRVSLLRGKKLLVPRSSVFGIFYPPFGIAQVRFEETRARVIGIAGRQSFVAQFATVPLLFTIDFAAALSGRQGAEEILKNARDPQPVEIPQASAL